MTRWKKITGEPHFSDLRWSGQKSFKDLRQIKRSANKALHWTWIPLRSIPASDLGRYALWIDTMKFFHHNLEIELDDEWWTEADMEDFVPKSKAYRVDLDAKLGRTVFEIRIDEVRPIKRNPGVGIFNDNAEASAKSRVVSILRGFIADTAIPPVEVIPESSGNDFNYKLVAGAHRFYCSLAAGFSHVPAVEGFDINTLDQ